jgi:chromosome segregation ATPase
MKQNKQNAQPDPVARAEREIERETAALKAHDAAKADLEKQLAEATDNLDAAEDSQARVRQRRLVVEVREDLASYNRKRPKLVAAVKEAQAALRKAQQAAAQAQIDEMGRRLEKLGTGITEGLERVSALIDDHSRLRIECDGVARQFDLPSPPRRRWPLPPRLIRSSGGEALRDALDKGRALGLPGGPAQPRAT